MSTYEKRLRDLWITAFEGGSNYWAMTNIRFGEKSREFMKQNNLAPSEFTFNRMWKDGREYKIFDAETGEKLGVINKAKLKEGYSILKKEYPEQYANIISENWDAETADIFLQLSVLGELTFG